ncbi:hypothetical protein D030_3155A, partial [Vibrio parahaemolyticus AQ3810]
MREYAPVAIAADLIPPVELEG